MRNNDEISYRSVRSLDASILQGAVASPATCGVKVDAFLSVSAISDTAVRIAALELVRLVNLVRMTSGHRNVRVSVY